jgi:GR25 family glycosyltransferase involved in LPS biosynthesis
LPNERSKIEKLTTLFRKEKIFYKIIDGVIINKNMKYLKYNLRWKYQKDLDDNLLNKFIFDENIYLRNNSDLKDINNKSKLWNHFLNFGKSQNRKLYEKTQIKLESELGNLIAHQNAIKDAIFKNYSKILILEDDVYIHKNFKDLHKDLIRNVNKFNIIYYGCIQKNWKDIDLKNVFYKANKCYGAFAYALDKSVFSKLIEITNNLEKSFEKCLNELIENFDKCYVSYPNIFITDLENGKIHRKREFEDSSKKFKWIASEYEI